LTLQPYLAGVSTGSGAELCLSSSCIRVLLIDDDEDDYVLVRDMLSYVNSSRYNIRWESTYNGGMDSICRGYPDVVLLDYHLGDRNGLDLLRDLKASDYGVPVILLTGQGTYELDMEAMRAGAADYLMKNEVNPALLERTIRYVLERSRAEEAIKKSQRALRLLYAQLLYSQENERKRIALVLHETLCQSLAAMKLLVDDLRDRADHESSSSRTLRELSGMMYQAIEETANLVRNLRPPVLDDVGILAAVSWIIREFRKAHPHIRIRERIPIEENEIDESLRIVIYRVLQEVLTNVTTHSEADRVDLSLGTEGNHIELIVKDNGRGFDPDSVLSSEEPCRSVGLRSMRERIQLSGGELEILTLPGSGTTIRVLWPKDDA